MGVGLRFRIEKSSRLKTPEVCWDDATVFYELSSELREDVDTGLPSCFRVYDVYGL